MGLFPWVQIFPNGQFLALAEVFPILEIHDPNNQKTTFHISLHVCMSVWTLVIDEMLAFKLAQYS